MEAPQTSGSAGPQGTGKQAGTDKTDHTHTPGAPVMSRELIRSQCTKHGGYTTEELNEKLFLHHFGFTRVENLEPYTECRVLYINHNALRDLEPLASLTKLTALYVSNNAIASCTTLPPLPSLQLLDVSQNFLRDLKGLAAAAPQLQTLLASHNVVDTIDKEHLAGFTELSTLDLGHNDLKDTEKLFSALQAVPALRTNLRTLILDGNAAQRQARHYRKHLISAFPVLRMLDALPVTGEERERAEAFTQGGPEAEARAVVAIQARQQQEQDARFRYHAAFMAGPRGRRMMQGDRSTPTPYYLAHAHGTAPTEGLATRQSSDDDDDDHNDVYIPAC